MNGVKAINKNTRNSILFKKKLHPSIAGGIAFKIKTKPTINAKYKVTYTKSVPIVVKITLLNNVKYWFLLLKYNSKQKKDSVNVNEKAIKKKNQLSTR